MAEAPADDAAILAEFDLDLTSKKKKKKKPKKVDAEGGAAGPAAAADDGRVYANYEYAELLQRVSDFIHAKDPERDGKKRTTMKPPVLMRVGTSRENKPVSPPAPRRRPGTAPGPASKV